MPRPRGLVRALLRGRRALRRPLGDDVMRAESPVIGQLIAADTRYGASAVGVQTVSPEAIAKYSSVKVTPPEAGVRHGGRGRKAAAGGGLFALCHSGRYVLTSAIFGILQTRSRATAAKAAYRRAKTLCHQERMVAVDFEGSALTPGTCAGSLRRRSPLRSTTRRPAPG